MRPRALAVLLLLAGLTEMAAAQAAAQPASRLTVAAGLVASGAYRIGDTTAQMRANAPGPASTVTMLRAESKIGAGIGLDARLAWALNRSVAVEAGGSYTTPQLRVTISQDPEVPGAIATERLAQYAVEVSGVYHAAIGRSASRVRPYIIAGLGYLWQVREDRVTRETGRTIHAGAGVSYVIRSGARGGSVGLRGEARLVRRRGGIEFQERGRNHPRLSVLALVGF